MPLPRPTTQNSLLQALLIAATSVLALFLWQGHKGFSLWDEGFLWLGANQLLLGDVPIRDFSSYDPGRYYWSAALMSLWGDHGIVALRGAIALFQAIGLFAALWLIGNTDRRHSVLYLLISAATLLAWMLPRHKLFDVTISILLLAALTLLITRPSTRRYFAAGLVVGMAAVFGRNHGVYGLLGSLATFAYLSIRRNAQPSLPRALTAWSVGIGVGFSPILAMSLLIPSFGSAFVDSVRFLFEIKTTNLTLPVLWPWMVDPVSLSSGAGWRKLVPALFLLSTVCFGVLGLLIAGWRRYRQLPVPPLLAAAAALALPYAHYALSRADTAHLAQGLFPTLIGLLALLTLLNGWLKWPLVLLLAAVSSWLTTPYHAGWSQLLDSNTVVTKVAGDSLSVRPAVASDIALLHQLTADYASDGRAVLITPFWPGAYPLLGRKSPLWENYALFPRSQAFQRAEIERIKKADPGFVLIFDFALDGHDELRFRHTHALIYDYIVANFSRQAHNANPAYQLYLPKHDSPSAPPTTPTTQEP